MSLRILIVGPSPPPVQSEMCNILHQRAYSLQEQKKQFCDEQFRQLRLTFFQTMWRQCDENSKWKWCYCLTCRAVVLRWILFVLRNNVKKKTVKPREKEKWKMPNVCTDHGIRFYHLNIQNLTFNDEPCKLPIHTCMSPKFRNILNVFKLVF